MPNMTTYRPRKGDVILVRATVRHDWNPGSKMFTVEIPGQYSTSLIGLEDIAGIGSLAYEVGDLVEARGKTGVIRAMAGDYVWVEPRADKDHSHPPFTAHIGMLTRMRDAALTEEDVQTSAGEAGQ